jgi:hypothetical protein
MGTWDDLYSAGERLGFAKGGAVKQSPQFKMKTGAQDSMDHGVQPARKGTTQQDIEAGGTPRLKPKFKKGGTTSRRAKKGKEKMAEKGKKELKKIVGGQITEKEAKILEKKKGRKRGRPGQKGSGKKGYQTGGAVKVHNSTPLIGS